MNPIEEKLQFIKDNCRTIVSVGSGSNDRLKSLFKNNEYKTLDIDKKTGADIIGDAHSMPIESNTFDAIVSLSLLEHTHSPHLVADEMFRILKPGGYALLTTPFIHPYHGGNCPDYYRFTHEGLEFLFKNFKSVEVKSDGGFIYALQYFVPRSLQFLSFAIEPTLVFLDGIFTKHRSSGHDMIVFAKK